MTDPGLDHKRFLRAATPCKLGSDRHLLCHNTHSACPSLIRQVQNLKELLSMQMSTRTGHPAAAPIPRKDVLDPAGLHAGQSHHSRPAWQAQLGAHAWGQAGASCCASLRWASLRWASLVGVPPLLTHSPIARQSKQWAAVPRRPHPMVALSGRTAALVYVVQCSTAATHTGFA